MSVRLLMPVLSPTAVEAGLDSVLARLSPQGEVAHEEDIGELAVLDHLKADGSRSAAPVYDYKMIDENYLLAPVAAAWLLQLRRPGALGRISCSAVGGPLRAARQPRRCAGRKSAVRGCKRAGVRAADPRCAHLIGLKPGEIRRRMARQRRPASAAAIIPMTSTPCWFRRRSMRPRGCQPAGSCRRI